MGSAEQLKLKVGWTVRDPLLVGMRGLRNLRERERERERVALSFY